MARITVEDCLEKVDNQYDLVLLAKERTSQLNSGSEMLVKEDNDKNTVVALREIAEGKVSVEDLKTNAVLRLRKEPDEIAGEEEQEEVVNDDFDTQYKGEVSKSGVAILPSKRARKISAQTTTPEEKEKQEAVEESKEESSDKQPLELTEEVAEESKEENQ
tara:strand:+ start:1154 stop:1636 length:483 start_codon:yes stop_codon:yes gene_type:complete